jgi:hypothetical protein
MKKGKSSTTIPQGSTLDYQEEKVAIFKFYVLIDPIDNEIKYVGRTVDEKNRLRNHIYESKKNNRNKRERWIVSLLRKNKKPLLKVIYKEKCSLEEAIKIEKMLVKKIGNRFNLKNSPDNYLGVLFTGQKVYQYDLDGNCINEFSNSNQAFIITGIKDSNILRCCKNPNGKGVKTAGNYFWSFIKYNKYPHKYLKNWRTIKGKPVIQLDKNMNILNEFITAREAEKITKISYKKISAVCNERQNSAGGFIWKFKY